MAPRLSAGEREEIGLGRAAGESIRSIARRLCRQPSTIGREVGRYARYGQPYKPIDAELASWQRHRRPKGRGKLARPGQLREEVLRLLRRRYSPEQVSGWLRVTFPDRPEMRVSHETIYQAIYVQARGNLRAELTRQVALRSGRARRRARPAAGGAVRSNRAWVGMNISQRPAEAADRAVPGHWEGDLVEGGHGGARGGAGAVITLVERSTRYVILIALPGGKVSEHVTTQLAAAMARLPQRLRASLTWDQGIEMARHTHFTLATDCPVFFCDPHSPWQRGSNENTNGLLRQYYPKGRTDFTKISQEDLDTVADELNDRPRKTLGWAKPSHKMAQLISGVATTP
jgi:IS30 family transposase